MLKYRKERGKDLEEIGFFLLESDRVFLTCHYYSFLVDAGHRAVIFDRFRGVQDIVVGEGTHFLIPWVQKPIIFDCRSRPRNVPVITGSKGESCLWLYKGDVEVYRAVVRILETSRIQRLHFTLYKDICAV
jgi:hypothetical protein